MAISCWRTKNTLNILVSKEDCAILADRLNQLQGVGASGTNATEAAVQAPEATDAPEKGAAAPEKGAQGEGATAPAANAAELCAAADETAA